MRSPGSVFRKMKELRYRHLVSIYRSYFKRMPNRCLYNHPYIFIDGDGIEKEIRLCLYNQDHNSLDEGIVPSLLDVCQELKHVQRCNAFVFKYDKDKLRKIFEDELQDEKIKSKKYPDIFALEWVLERYSTKTVPGIVGILWYKIKKFLNISYGGI